MGNDEQLAEDADEALRRAAPIAAMEMMRQRLVVGVERRMREGEVASLLWGETPSPSALEQVGLPADEELVVLAFEVVSRGTSSPTVVGLRMIDLLSAHLRAYERPAVATSAGERPALPALEERIYVLASSGSAEDLTKLRKIANESMIQAARTLGVELRGGIGHQIAPGGDLRLARQSAQDCLASASAANPLVLFEEIHDKTLIRDVDRFVGTWHGGPNRAYLALKEHDEAHGTEYLLTLRYLFDAFGGATVVADRLHIHVNTVRYRIRRIVEICDVDLHDGDSRLALELALRALGPADERSSD
jgi:sugar diacid utilization regulator